jgi:hypothetical protein
MARDFAELTALFRNSLRDRFGLPEATTPGATRLCFALGTPLPDDGFRTEPGGEYFPLGAMEFMSHHCNVAPHIVGDMFLPTINEVDDLYGLLLAGSSPATAADAELLGAIKLEAKAAFDVTLGSTIPPGFDTFRPTHAVPERWFDQDQSANWTTISIAQSPPEPPPQPPPGGSGGGGGGGSSGGGGGGGGVGGGGGGGRPRFPLMFRPVDPGLAGLLAEPVTVESAKTLKVGAKLALADAAATPFADTHFVDRSALVNAVLAVDREPGSARLARSPRPVRELPIRIQRALAAEERLAAAARRRISASELRTSDRPFRHFSAAIRSEDLRFEGGVELTSKRFGLDAELCLVNLRRSWLSTAFLRLGNWFVQSFDKGGLSSGDPEDGSPFAVIPVACVLVRNLRIHAEWSTADQQQSLASTHLGPFSLAGRRFDTTTATLSVPGMQSVAWLCEPLPPLPPRSTPA